MKVNVTQNYATMFTSCDQMNKAEETHKYLLSNFTGYETSINVARESEGLLPYAGVAVKLTSQEMLGKLFCFLPLPIESHLPVHVNSIFELNSSRKALAHVSSDSKNFDHRMHSSWNMCLWILQGLISILSGL